MSIVGLRTCWHVVSSLVVAVAVAGVLPCLRNNHPRYRRVRLVMSTKSTDVCFVSLATGLCDTGSDWHADLIEIVEGINDACYQMWLNHQIAVGTLPADALAPIRAHIPNRWPEAVQQRHRLPAIRKRIQPLAPPAPEGTP